MGEPPALAAWQNSRGGAGPRLTRLGDKKGTQKVDKKLWILIAHLLGLVFCLPHTSPAANKAESGLPLSIQPSIP